MLTLSAQLSTSGKNMAASHWICKPLIPVN
jgi:hypothetical protein